MLRTRPMLRSPVVPNGTASAVRAPLPQANLQQAFGNHAVGRALQRSPDPNVAPAPAAQTSKLTFWMNAFIPGDVPDTSDVPAGKYAGKRMLNYLGSCF